MRLDHLLSRVCWGFASAHSLSVVESERRQNRGEGLPAGVGVCVGVPGRAGGGS